MVFQDTKNGSLRFLTYRNPKGSVGAILVVTAALGLSNEAQRLVSFSFLIPYLHPISPRVDLRMQEFCITMALSHKRGKTHRIQTHEQSFQETAILLMLSN